MARSSLSVLEGVLRDAALSTENRYLILSALLGIERLNGDFSRLDGVLEGELHRDPDGALAPLVALWWGDNALYDGRPGEALRRYEWAADAYGRTKRRLAPWIMGRPLDDWLTLQSSAALFLLGRGGEAAARLESAGRRSGMGRFMFRVASTQWWAAGRKREARALRKKRPEPRPSPWAALVRAPRVRPLSSLRLKAPWPAGTYQRAGVLTRGPWSYLRYALGGFRAGNPESPCGKAAAGYFYDGGSHSHRRASGRLTYGVDFTAPGPPGAAWGTGSFGTEVRVAGEGIVRFVWYGTRTHHGGRARGPAPANNQVVVSHFPPEVSSVAAVLGRIHHRRRGAPITRLWSEAWDYLSLYLHLVGLEDPCPRPRSRGARRSCIPHPALVSVGQYLWSGSPLGFQDSAGYSWIDHLHFQINQTCRASGVSCPASAPFLRWGRSVPLYLEGKPIDARDRGACLESSNRMVLFLDRNSSAIPDVLDPILETIP